MTNSKGIGIETAGGKPKAAAQPAADQHQDEADSWGDLLDRRPVGRAN